MSEITSRAAKWPLKLRDFPISLKVWKVFSLSSISALCSACLASRTSAEATSLAGSSLVMRAAQSLIHELREEKEEKEEGGSVGQGEGEKGRG